MKIEECFTYDMNKIYKWWKICIYISLSLCILGVTLTAMTKNPIFLVAFLVGFSLVGISSSVSMWYYEHLDIDENKFHQYVIEKATIINKELEKEETK